MKIRNLILSSAAALCVSAIAPAQAAQCPPSQIYRVSKKICMDKGEAIAAGIVRGKPAVAGAADAPEAATPAAVAEKPVTLHPQKAAEKPVEARAGKVAVKPAPRAKAAVEDAAAEQAAAEQPAAETSVRSQDKATPPRDAEMRLARRMGGDKAIEPLTMPESARALAETPKPLTPSPFGGLK